MDANIVIVLSVPNDVLGQKIKIKKGAQDSWKKWDPF